MSKIALLPGGFKPPHAGHYNMAKWLSANTGADTTIIFVGPKERDGITQAMSLKLWELYTQNDSGLEVRPAGVSPVIMDEIFQHILNIKKQNIAILMVEQNARQALEISDRGYILVTGKNAYEGDGEYLLNDKEIRKSFLGG